MIRIENIRELKYKNYNHKVYEKHTSFIYAGVKYYFSRVQKDRSDHWHSLFKSVFNRQGELLVTTKHQFGGDWVSYKGFYIDNDMHKALFEAGLLDIEDFYMEKEIN